MPELTGIFMLSSDLSKLVNNKKDSDVKFEVGGATLTTPDFNDGTTLKSSESTTFYAHTVILRSRSAYFDNQFDKYDWKSSGTIYKPDISPSTFNGILFYIYTGSLDMIDNTILLELTISAEEMQLHELSRECQRRIIELLHRSLSNEEDSKNIPKQYAIQSFLIPGLVISTKFNLTLFYENLHNFTIEHIKAICSSQETLNTFLKAIPSEIISHILRSSDLDLDEFEVWELAFDWACIKNSVPRITVESQLRSNAMADGEQKMISNEKLEKVRATVQSLLTTVRFTRMTNEKYFSNIDIFNFFFATSSSRWIGIQKFFLQRDVISAEPPRKLIAEVVAVLPAEPPIAAVDVLPEPVLPVVKAVLPVVKAVLTVKK